MSLTDSPLHSSSSDEFAEFAAFAAILDRELETISDESAEVAEEKGSDGDDEGYYGLDDVVRVKRRKVEIIEDVINPPSSSDCSGSWPKKDICAHGSYYAGMCTKCGQKADQESGVAFRYIHKNLRLTNDEIVRLRDDNFKKLLRDRKLCLVLDLDHTLINSTRFEDITVEEGYLKGREDLPEKLRSSLVELDRMQMMTKLRPFVHTFLVEASKLFEMYIYTMGERPYAVAMGEILDSGGSYFNSRIIAQGDCTQRLQKGLDIVFAPESAVLILDDTEGLWGKHKANLILMERYNFFASSCKHSLSVRRSDESETEGALLTVLKILQQIHNLFFDQSREDDLEGRDVRQILKTVREEILKGCTIVFSRVFPTNSRAKDHYLWKMAEQLGASCTLEVDPSVTHVVALDSGTEKSRWAVREKKFLVHPCWIEASNYMWLKQPEENFPIPQTKSKCLDL